MCNEPVGELEGKHYCFCCCSEVEPQEENDQKKGDKTENDKI